MTRGPVRISEAPKPGVLEAPRLPKVSKIGVVEILEPHEIPGVFEMLVPLEVNATLQVLEILERFE